MIKLVASDIDGTLLPEGSDKINEELFDVIRQLKEKGIMFAAASGRQYHSIHHVFAPVENDIIFIAENGANVICRGHAMASVQIDPDTASELITYIKSIPNCYPVVSTVESMYAEKDAEDMIDLLLNSFHVKLKVVDDLLEENLDAIKITLYRKNGVDEIAPPIIAEWKDRIHGMVAGEYWIDFMDYMADKGEAIKTIQSQMNIAPEESMAFGDNHNDIGMMKAAGESYAVGNARQAVKDAAKHIADTSENDGVLKVLKTLLKEG